MKELSVSLVTLLILFVFLGLDSDHPEVKNPQKMDRFEKKIVIKETSQLSGKKSKTESLPTQNLDLEKIPKDSTQIVSLEKSNTLETTTSNKLSIEADQ